jgi:FXSXX-COOH protein
LRQPGDTDPYDDDALHKINMKGKVGFGPRLLRAAHGDGEGLVEDGERTDPGWRMPDLTGVPLLDLCLDGDSVLMQSIRRLLAEAEDPPEAVAGFNAVI